MMAKKNEQIKIMDQIIKRMEKHNFDEAEVDKDHIRLKKEKPQDIADREEQRKLDEIEQAEAKRLAEIRLREILGESG